MQALTLPIYSIWQIGYIGLMAIDQALPAGYDPGHDNSLPLPPHLLRELRQALRTIRYGAIELVIHDGRVVQLELRAKVRFETDGTERRR